jgi:hypothetical protein
MSATATDRAVLVDTDCRGRGTGSVFLRALDDRLRDGLDEHTVWRFGIRPGDRAQLGVGTIDIETAWWARPLLAIWGRAAIGVVHRGTDVPFTIVNVGFIDEHGREGVTVSRRFHTRGIDREPERFDATMLASPNAASVDDLLGDHQCVLAELGLSVDPDTAGIRFTGRGRGLRWVRSNGRRSIGLPWILAGRPTVHEWWDHDDACFAIEVTVNHPVLGTAFRYRGRFTVTEVDSTHPLVAEAMPHECRLIG